MSALADARADFTAAEVARARSYRRPLYAARLGNIGVGLVVLAVLAFAAVGETLSDLLTGLPWAAEVLVLTAIVLGVLAVVRLPIGYWAGYRHEHRFGLSTQGLRGWFADRGKGLAVGIALTSAGLIGLLGSARLFPEAWPAVAAAGGAALVVFLSFIAPIILEPIFHRFEPLPDRGLDSRIRELANRAGVPVRDVLVADASRRTRKANAYVSGFGRTRRVVFFDTLLEEARSRGLMLVTAHELAHRRERHVLKGTLLGAGGTASIVLILYAVTRSDTILEAIGADEFADPAVIPFVLLLGAILELLVLPFGSALSRRWERIADRISLELTDDVDAFITAHRELARSNLSDLDPPRSLYAILFTHPTPPERISFARRWQAANR